METKKKDVVVVGAGPGGYVCAIRLAQLGKSVALVHKDRLGGVCLNWGCIPSKALVHAARMYEGIKGASEIGIEVKGVSLDLKKTQAWKTSVVERLTAGIGQLLKANGVEVIAGEARFETPHMLRVTKEGSAQFDVEFTHAVVATGSQPMEIPGFSIDQKNVVDSTAALEWTKPPARLLVIGGGVIGLEIGTLYQKFGSVLTVVELTDQLLPGVDSEVAESFRKILKKRGTNLHLSTKALSYEKTKDGLRVSLETPKGPTHADCDVILLAVGRRSSGKDLGLEDLGVDVQKHGHIPVDSRLTTTVPHILAIGDVTGPPLLAHRASKQGLVAASVIAGENVEYDVRAMPAAVFTDPEIATVGMTQEEARLKGHDAYCEKFPFAASGRALASRQTEGFVKIVADGESRRLLGVAILGPEASDLIGEAALAIEMGALVDDLALTVHPHPTLSEALMEAAEAALGHPVHTLPRKGAKDAKSG